MPVFKLYKRPKCALHFPVDYRQVIERDEDGNEFPTYVEEDLSKVVVSHGSVEFYKLDAMLRAGIDPNIPIHTTNPTQAETHKGVEAFVAASENFIKEPEQSKTE